MASDTRQILQELKVIKKELDFIKENMVDIDNVMTEEDYKSLLDYRKQKLRGKLISHKQLEKEFGL